jgi:hypothetical protein
MLLRGRLNVIKVKYKYKYKYMVYAIYLPVQKEDQEGVLSWARKKNKKNVR